MDYNRKKLSKFDKKLMDEQLNEEKILYKLDKLQKIFNKKIKIYDNSFDDDIKNEYYKLKSNLKSIIDNNSDIDIIVNYFNITNIKKINKYWDEIKKNFIKLYGVYNHLITNKQIITFLNDKIVK
jgi:hypothetical protein